MNPRTGNTGLAQRLWTRYTRFSAAAPHTRLARRIYRAHGHHVPLLHALQRRWQPPAAAPFQTARALPYISPFLAAHPQPLAAAPFQGNPASVVQLGVRAGGAVTTKPLVTAQRRSSMSSSASAVTSGANPATAFVQPVSHVSAASPLPQQVQRQASLPTLARPTENVPTPLAVRPVTSSALPLAQRSATLSTATPARGEPAVDVTPISPDVANTQAQAMPASVTERPLVRVRRQTMPTDTTGPARQGMVQRTETGSSRPENPIPERQTAAYVSTPVVQRQAAPGRQGMAEQLARSVQPVVVARHTVTGSSPAASPLAAPALGAALVQRHSLTPQPSIGETFTSAPSAAMRSQDTAISSLLRQHIGPILRVTTSMSAAGSRTPSSIPVARSVAPPLTPLGVSKGQWPARQATNGHTALPLAGPVANGGMTPLQRQTEPPEMSTPSGGAQPTAPQSMQAAATSTPAADTDRNNPNATDELVDQLWRKLLRRLAVEGERRGARG